jgi:hypothetical protein
MERCAYRRKSGDFIANLLEEHGDFIEAQAVVGIRIVKVKQVANLEHFYKRRRSIDSPAQTFSRYFADIGIFFLIRLTSHAR